MLKVVKAERVHVSIMVSSLNRKAHDYALYAKYKFTIDEIDSELDSWVTILNESTPHAFMKVHEVNWNNRTVKYTIILCEGVESKLIVKECIRHLLYKYNCNKLITDIIYDRNDTIKDHISIGGKIEVRKRHHLYMHGKYHNVVEMAIFRNEFKDERVKG